MSIVGFSKFFMRQKFLFYQRASFATQPVVDPIQRAFVEKLREYQEKSKSAEMGLVGASQAQVKALKDSLEKLDNAFGAKGVDMCQFPVLHHKDPELVNPGSSIVAEYPPPELLQSPEDAERTDGVLTKGPIVI